MTKWMCMAGLLTGLSSADAAEIAGVTFAPKFSAEPALVVHGVALKEATFLGLDVYVVALYAAEGWRPGTDVPASLVADSLGGVFVVHFLREISCRKLADSWVEDLERACEPPCDDVLAEARVLARKLPDVRRGDRIRYLVTRSGVDVQLGDASLGTLTGARAARAVAAAFLGPRAPEDLRETLLSSYATEQAAR